MNKRESHPVFPNPTVTEAIIEVYLASVLSNKTLDTIFDIFKLNYPEHHRDQLVSYQATVGERGMSISQEKQPGQVRLQFKNSCNNFLIQVFHNRLSMHRIANYDGWDPLMSDFLKTWEQIIAIAHEFSTQRIGVRFINKLNEKNIDHPLKTWLNPSPYYPEILLNSHTGFFFRGQWASDHETEKLRTYIVSIAEGGADGNTRPLMFDIDIVQSYHGKDRNLISDLASELHEEIWKIFISSISENYLKILKKE